MSISDKNRKLLWGRAASRCAICRIELVMEGRGVDQASVVGDECHIIAREAGGPRGGEPWPDPLDAYSNLILLCKVHHKLVDDQPNHFTSENLRLLKRAHEDWVRLALGRVDNDSDQAQQPILTWRLASGRDVTNLLSGIHGYHLDNDQPQDSNEAELMGTFLQAVHDWGEIWEDIEPNQQVEAQLQLQEQINALEQAGFFVFGAQITRPEWFAGKRISLRRAVVRVARASSPHVIDLSQEAQA